MRTSAFLLAAVVALAAPGACRAQSGSMEGRWVVSGKDMVGIGPTALVAGPTASSVEWSPTGRYVSAVRTSIRATPAVLKGLTDAIKRGQQPSGPPPGDVGIVIWSAASQQSTEVWKRSSGAGSVLELHWIAGQDFALARVREEVKPPSRPGAPPEPPQSRESLLWINAELGSARSVLSVDASQGGWMMTYPSPIRPLVLVCCLAVDSRTHAQDEVLYVLGENGRLRPPVVVPQELTPLVNVQWSEDGANLLLMCRDRDASAAQNKAAFRWYRLDATSGRIAPRTNERAYTMAPPPPDVPVGGLQLAESTVAAKEDGTNQSVSLLWLCSVEKGDPGRALIAADATGGRLAPSGDALLYQQGGAAWVAPLFRIDRQAFEEMRNQARRMVALSNGKQLMLGLLMYSQDFDNKMPAGGQDVNALIMPYVKNESVFSGFVYTFPGGSLSDFSQPATTEVGYVTGPGGRAVMYLDGHVMWRDDK